MANVSVAYKCRFTYKCKQTTEDFSCLYQTLIVDEGLMWAFPKIHTRPLSLMVWMSEGTTC